MNAEKLKANISELLAAALALSMRFEQGHGAQKRQRRLYDLLVDYQSGHAPLDGQVKVRCHQCIDCHRDSMAVLEKFKDDAVL